MFILELLHDLRFEISKLVEEFTVLHFQFGKLRADGSQKGKKVVKL